MEGRIVWRVLALMCVACLFGTTNALIQVSPKSQHFVGPDGRVRLFHGVNAVYKVPPYLPSQNGFDPETSLCDEDIDNLVKWGFNAVRLGFMWPGVQPNRLLVNGTYLKEVNNLVNRLGQKGIFTILDMHQDLLSNYFCGEGVPDWVVPKSRAISFPWPLKQNVPVDKNKHPIISECVKTPFFFFYVSQSVSVAFQQLYDNVNGFLDSLVKFWTTSAKFFANNEYVLGYELINEPWFGDIYAHPSLLLAGNADRKNLVPMYKKLHEAIRKVDDKHIIFYEPNVVNLKSSGFEVGPGGKEYDDRQVFSYHLYCGLVNREGEPFLLPACNITETVEFQYRVEDSRRIGGGAFLTELGATNNSPKGIRDLHGVLGVADRELQSWAYWQFKSFKDFTTAGGDAESFYFANGTLQEAKVKALSRTYAQITSGLPVQQSFDPYTGNFVYKYLAAPGVTEIYLNEEWYYPHGYNLQVTPSTKVKTSRAKNRVLVSLQDASTDLLEITVNITPTPPSKF